VTYSCSQTYAYLFSMCYCCTVQVEIKLCCLIGDTTARDLAAGLEHLEDELIIRIDVRLPLQLLEVSHTNATQ
jgi:hypothetical protein